MSIKLNSLSKREYDRTMKGVWRKKKKDKHCKYDRNKRVKEKKNSTRAIVDVKFSTLRYLKRRQKKKERKGKWKNIISGKKM